MLVMTNMYHLLIFVTFNKLGLDNEWQLCHSKNFITMPAQHQNKQPGIESLMSPFRSLKMQTIKEVKS